VLVVASLWWPLQRIGSEFMPALDEGDLPCMPSLFPGVSIGKAREILQQTDRLIATVLGVQSVHGKRLAVRRAAARRVATDRAGPAAAPADGAPAPVTAE